MDGHSTHSFLGRLPFLSRGLLIAICLVAAEAAADPLPLRVQAVLIEKILLFDRSLPAGEKPLVVLLYGDEIDQAEVLHRALTELRINSALVSGADLRPMPHTQVIYVFPHAWSTALRDWSLQKKAITFCGDQSMVRSGQAAIALSLEDRKPRILVNLTITKAQGHDLSSELLSVASVIK